jgi:hypothetical protein
MPHTIFIVHGMGNHTGPALDAWANQVQAALEFVYANVVQPALPGQPAFAHKFTVVPIGYDAIFNRFTQAWAASATGWSGLTGLSDDVGRSGLSANYVNGFAQFFNGATGANLGWTHAADVILYAMPTVRAALTTSVAATLSAAIGGLGANQYSILAHSLGTAVIQDAYSVLAVRANQGGIALNPPRTILTLSNVSKALQDDVQTAYQAELAPGTGGGRPGSFLNGRNPLDFISLLDRFDPQGAGEKAWLQSGPRYRDCITEPWLAPQTAQAGGMTLPLALDLAIRAHSIENYLLSPTINVPFFANMLGVPALQGIFSEKAVSLQNALTRQNVKQLETKLVRALAKAGNTTDLKKISVLNAILGWLS